MIRYMATDDQPLEDLPADWQDEDREMEGRKPRLDETEEDEAGE